MVAEPYLVGGRDRLDTELMRASGGQVLVKEGAEALVCASIMPSGLGIAIKVADGGSRADEPALVSRLAAAGRAHRGAGTRRRDLRRSPGPGWRAPGGLAGAARSAAAGVAFRVMSPNPRVAVLSVHTSPVDQPGIGDSGGMNVYIRAVAERLAGHGLDVDLFTRCRGGQDHEVKELGPGIRVVSVKAGPCAPVPKADLPRFLPEFLGGMLRIAHEDGRGYDIVHSHYWLSGWVGRAAREAWDVPLVASFHTLGKVKNYSLARGEAPEPAGSPRRRTGRDLRSRSDPGTHAVGSVAARRAVSRRSIAPSDRASGCRPRDLHAARSREGAGSGSTCLGCGSRCTSADCSRTRAPTSR